MALTENTDVPISYKENAKEAVIKRAPSYGFGTSTRAGSATTRNVPGPGSYPSVTLIGKEFKSRGKSLSFRHPMNHEKETPAHNPGPGAYNSPACKDNVMLKFEPSWKMGSSTRNDYTRRMKGDQQTPPPDAYKPLYSSTLSAAPRSGIGSGQRSTLIKDNGQPGPHTYKIKSRAVEGPKFYMGLKLESKSSIGTLVN